MGKDRSCGSDSGIDDNGGRGCSSYKDDGDSRNDVDHGDSCNYYGGGGDKITSAKNAVDSDTRRYRLGCLTTISAHVFDNIKDQCRDCGKRLAHQAQ